MKFYSVRGMVVNCAQPPCHDSLNVLVIKRQPKTPALCLGALYNILIYAVVLVPAYKL